MSRDCRALQQILLNPPTQIVDGAKGSVKEDRAVSPKSLGWCALCICLGAVTVTAFSRGGSPATQTTAAAPRTSEITFVSVHGANPGGYASVTVETASGAECSIRYVTPHSTISRAKGLGNQIADSDGKVTWTWKIGSKTEPGKGSVIVTCNGSTATTSITIER